MEEPSVCITPATDVRIISSDSPSRIRSTMSTPKSPSASSDDCEAPEYKCAICLGRLRNKSLIDSCFHEFCFECLVEWSKIKPECPLCKTKFDYIVHNVRSNDDYEKYHCQSNQPDNGLQIPWVEPNRSFRYRTTMTPEMQETLALQQIVALREQNTSGRRSSNRRYQRNSQPQRIPDFRSRVYRENLWVQPLSDVTNRFRECSPLFYRENPAQVYRLVRWLQRELMVLLPLNCPHRTFVMQTIINNVFQHPIRSSFFATQLQPYLGPNTRHFIHEFAEYARSPYDMTGHDRAATYLPHGPGTIEEVVLNSPTSSEFSIDDLDEFLDSSGSDVEIIEDNVNPLPVAGPSGVGRSAATRRSKRTSCPIKPLSNEETHEIISSSSSDECEVIGTFKPPTPEVIDILSSDEEIPQTSEENTPSCSVSENRTSQKVDDKIPQFLGSDTQSPDIRAPNSLEDSVDRPRLIFKIEPGRIKNRLKKRKLSHSEDRWSSSSSEKAVTDSPQSSSNSRDWMTVKSENGNWHGRIPSVVVPQPSFKMDASSSRFGSNDEEASELEETKERTKKKKSKHSKKHKRSHKNIEEDDRGEGTSGSSSSRRCKVCRHKHCRCNRDSSRKHKKSKNHPKEVAEEWESASGSSRSKSKTKKEKHSQLRHSESRFSDSSD